jgi:SAM-dependent methyltransferase
MMKREYCAVGPTIVLLGWPHESSDVAMVLRAERRPGEQAGRLAASLGRDAVVRVELREPPHRAPPGEMAELLRLSARVCADFWGYRFPLELRLAASVDPAVAGDLAGDGFTTTDGAIWRRPATLFTRRGPKAHGMEEVYHDLFSVPWNFVPREWDVLQPMIDDAEGASLSILDLGCGVGKNVEPLETRGFTVYGVDPSHTAVRRCRAIVAHPERFVVGTAARLPWCDGCFDRVLDVGALHCMNAIERRMAVMEISRVLAAGGMLYSRFFTPRPATWLELQPMTVDRFGLTVDEVRELLNGPLTCRSVTEDRAVIHAIAIKADA